VIAGLAAVLAAAALIRLYHLGEGLWLDEITTFVKYARSPFLEIIDTFDSENQHVLYSLLAHASFVVFGESAWALRLPAVLFGVGSIAVLFFLGRRVTKPGEALLASAFLAFAYHHVWFSQNARGYSGLLFWTLLSSLFFLRALQDGRTADWVGYALTAAFGVWTHLTMVFVVAGNFLSFLLRVREHDTRRLARGIGVGFAGSAVATLILYGPVLADIRTGMGNTLTGVAGMWNSPLWTVRELFAGLAIGPMQLAVLAVALGVTVAGTIDYLRTRRIVVELALFGAVIGATITLLLGHPVWPRFFLFAMGFVALIVFRGVAVAARFCARLFRATPAPAARFEVVAGALLVFGSALGVPRAWEPKQDFVGALDYVEANRAPADAVAVVNLTVLAYTEYFDTDWRPVDSVQALDALRASADRTWIVYTLPQVLEVNHPDLMAAITGGFRTVREFGGTLGDGEIYVAVAEKKPGGPDSGGEPR
jgi:4-amino-4-deoxy-L-arabinose transferase-like glycosyltransferase